MREEGTVSGEIVRTEPPEGTELEEGETLRVFVSRGRIYRCGGNTATSNCYTLNVTSRAWEQTESMLRARDRATVVGFGADRHLIIGGGWTGDRNTTELAEAGESGSVVSMICDPGERYLHSYYSDDWVAAQGLELGPYLEQLTYFRDNGMLPPLRS